MEKKARYEEQGAKQEGLCHVEGNLCEGSTVLEYGKCGRGKLMMVLGGEESRDCIL